MPPRLPRAITHSSARSAVHTEGGGTAPNRLPTTSAPAGRRPGSFSRHSDKLSLTYAIYRQRLLESPE